MALIFVAVDEEDSLAGQSVPITTEAFSFIVDGCERNNLVLLGRMADYWTDAVFIAAELQILKIEIETLMGQIDSGRPFSGQLTSLFNQMLAVVEFAGAKEFNVEAVAD